MSVNLTNVLDSSFTSAHILSVYPIITSDSDRQFLTRRTNPVRQAAWAAEAVVAWAAWVAWVVWAVTKPKP